jgi:hypothetical protein
MYPHSTTPTKRTATRSYASKQVIADIPLQSLSSKKLGPLANASRYINYDPEKEPIKVDYFRFKLLFDS